MNIERVTVINQAYNVWANTIFLFLYALMKPDVKIRILMKRSTVPISNVHIHLKPHQSRVAFGHNRNDSAIVRCHLNVSISSREHIGIPWSRSLNNPMSRKCTYSCLFSVLWSIVWNSTILIYWYCMWYSKHNNICNTHSYLCTLKLKTINIHSPSAHDICSSSIST